MDARLQMLRRQTDRPARIGEVTLEALGRGELGLAEALALSREDLEALRERAMALLEAGRADKARALFELLLVLEGEDPGTTLLLASCHQQLGDLNAARAFVACVLDPQNGAPADLIAAAQSWSATMLGLEGVVS